MKTKLYQRLIMLIVAISAIFTVQAWAGQDMSRLEFVGNQNAGEVLTGKHKRTYPNKTNSANFLINHLRHWHRISLDATSLDHTPVIKDDTRVFGEQLGPNRSSRAMAIVHIAIFDALNAIENRYESYTGIAPVSKHTDKIAAISQAAHDTLVALFPCKQAFLANNWRVTLPKLLTAKQNPQGLQLASKLRPISYP